MIVECPDFDDSNHGQLVLRDYQRAAVDAISAGWGGHQRQLLDMATGTGKTAILNHCAASQWAAGGRTLILENRDALVRQTAKRAQNDTGLDVDIEMAGDRASPFAPIVVASVQTLFRDARLIGFDDQHFQLVVADESHHALSKSWAKVMRYFHYGAESLVEDWETPPDGTYPAKSRVLGVTATPELSGNRHLGEFFQHIPFSYQLLKAVNDGWLVPPLAVQEPLPLNLKGLRPTRTPNGSDYNPSEVAERMIPIIEELAKQIVRVASDRKTMAFMPSINTASLLAQAINRNGLRAVFVSGECLDRDEKTEVFVNHGRGIVLTTSALYTEGFDVPDVDAVFPGITKSISYFKQKVGRATRPLRGIVDGLPSANERRAAIAASDKPNFLIIDPFCRIDYDIDICDTYDLFTDKPEVKARMKALGSPSEESAQEAERDFVKSLEKEARKAAQKKSRTIDPLKFSLMVGDDALAHYLPQSEKERRPPTVGQLAFLQQQRVDVSQIKSFGYASKLIGRIMTRINNHLATYEQLQFLKHLGLPEEKTVDLKMKEASELIDRLKAERRTA